MKKLLYMLLGMGAAILLIYPLVSNYLYENRQDGIVSQYTSSVTDSTEEARRLAVLREAQTYNHQLATGVISIEDLEENTLMNLTENDILDVTGTGVIATVSIPKLDQELPVYYGTADDTLEHGVGLLEISSLPVGGESTHSVLCGHSGLNNARVFSDLELLEVGDTFSVQVLDETLLYTVDQIVTVLPEDLTHLAIIPGEDHCTLLTCTPYGINTHRLLVRGTRTILPKAEQHTEQEPTGESIWLREYLMSLATGLGVAAALLITVFGIRLWRFRHG